MQKNRFRRFMACLLLLSFLCVAQVMAASIYPAKYQPDDNCLQLVVVRYRGSSKGSLIFYQGERKERLIPMEAPQTQLTDLASQTKLAAQIALTEQTQLTATAQTQLTATAQTKLTATAQTQLTATAQTQLTATAQTQLTAQSMQPEEDVLIEEYTVWKKVFSATACLGRKGIGKKKEGDGKTPTGQFGLGQAFGILANPGSKMPYVKVNRYHYWCSDSGTAYYNKLIRTDKTKHKCKGEHLINFKGSYDYGLFIKYNENGIKGKGSAIFLHCSKGKATAGCVAIPKSSMKKLLKALKPGKHPMIIIDRW